MKTSFLLALGAVAALGLHAAAPRAHAQANLVIGGGNGDPLFLTLSDQVNYTVTTSTTPGDAPYFRFAAVGFPATVNEAVNGTMQFTINGGAPQQFAELVAGFPAGIVAADDAYIYGLMPGVNVGDTVSLLPGTLTTSANYPSAAATSGSFSTLLFNGAGEQISGLGMTVPEPSTWALAVGGLGLLGVLGFRRHSRTA